MIRKIFILICFFVFQQHNSQALKKFSIPKGKNKIFKYDYDINFNIHLQKNGTVYLNNKKIKLKNLADSIIKIKSNVYIQEFTSVTPILFIEHNTSFKIVEKLKAEISRAWVSFIIYKTQNKDFYSGFKRKLHMSSNYIEGKVILSKSNNYEIDLDTANFNGLAWEAELEFDLYSGNFKKVLRKLKSIDYQKLKIIDKNYFEVDGNKVQFNILNLTRVIANKKVIFISYDKKLKYQDYLFFLSLLNNKKIISVQNIFKVNKKHIPFIEISNELNRKLKLKNVKF